MEKVEKSIAVRCPASTVYDQWTQIEDFPRIMDGVREVQARGRPARGRRPPAGGAGREAQPARASEERLYRTEREYGSFYRAIRLPDHAEPDSARATMDDGVLTITIRAPREGRREGRRVSIEGA